MTEILSNMSINEPICLGMGFFDCLHMGHRQLIQTVKQSAQKIGAKTAIITFSNNPYKRFNPQEKLVFTYDERLFRLQNMGIDYIIPLKFDSLFKQTSKEDFLQSLFSRFDIKCVVCGYDYLFGARGEGEQGFLTEYSRSQGSDCVVQPPVTMNMVRISTTLVKECLNNGDIVQANKYLCEPYFMQGEVIKGHGIGKTYGFPTANISLSKNKMLPKIGVYKTSTIFEGKKYNSLTTIGTRPTFDEFGITVETYIEDFNANLYGKNIAIEYQKYIRPIKKFANSQELKQQITKDLQAK